MYINLNASTQVCSMDDILSSTLLTKYDHSDREISLGK